MSLSIRNNPAKQRALEGKLYHGAKFLLFLRIPHMYARFIINRTYDS
jgi:hypothetical protein